jgi:hypothetical protein
MIFVVLGMHKSGTTLVARALHQSGIVMGQEFPSDADYTRVKYEARSAQEITDEILGIPRKQLSLEVTSRALPVNGVQVEAIQRMRRMAAELDERYGDWGFKDPRAALTYRYWKQGLPPHRVIIIYRDPVEVWRRYARVNRKWWSRTAFKVWCDYNKSILSSVSVHEGSKVLALKFEELLSGDDEWKRLEEFAGRELVDVRDPGQSRFRVNADRRNMLVYKLLQKLAGSEASTVYQQLESLRNRRVVSKATD